MDSLQLISSKKEFIYFIISLFLIFIFNIFYEYFKYKDFIKEEVYLDRYEIINIYKKDDFNILKLQNQKLTLFTSVDKSKKLQKLDYINIAVVSKGISFYEFLKGFYTKSLFIEKIEKTDSFKKSIFTYINNSHKDEKIQELFNALFLAIPILKENRQIYTDFGISHLIAISGFHLGILSSILFTLIYYPYSFFHQRYFPYRNKKADVLLLTIFILLYYLILTNLVASLFRAFIMFVLAFAYLRANIKVFSFQTLLITLLLIIAFFPKYLFSISLWFSIIGVFYIFLYIQYFKTLPKVFSIFLFNFWIFFVFNPIVHFFFPNTSYEQLLSPFLTIFFTIFYPFELILHLFNFATLLDKYIAMFLEYKMSVYSFETSLSFFTLYILISLISIFNKRAFILLNFLLIIFNVTMFF
ncbi:ComEC/Rec2 family competence protein [Halarcobacter bivalviorum]|uniref:Competence protein n=1 Tax=Halarcobacter bivalviorum TaxID=663364 RepID=A0AAX2AD57_9BACT|nr:ComEC/Rec2 family competence protein [Halarcobacter bivalviorum]AXH12189.1 competence protein, ComEC family [Halarcobacter bivalviorum]RXK11294.1 competence protein [Halarcobacter bivalviorum]